MIRRSYSAFALPVEILILTNPSTQWHPLPSPSVFRFFFLLLFTVNMGAAGVCMGKEKREQNERSSCSASLSDRAKNTPPLRALSLPSSSSPRSFSLPLSTRSFLLAFSRSPLHTLTSLAVDSLCSSHAPNRRSLAINKKRKKKRKNNESGAGVSGVE